MQPSWKKLIAELDNPLYKVRQKATVELAKIGRRAGPAIEKALTGELSLESRNRLRELRDKMTATVLQGEELRIYRAVEALEWMGSPEARQLLTTLAEGPPGAFTTEAAKSALRK